MQLVIKTLAGSEVSLNFEPEDTILTIKQTLQEKEGIEVPMIKLIQGGK